MADLDGVFRREWGPAVAALARWSGDLTVAEDAVQEACAEAVNAWPRDGMPDNPGAWIVRVARNRALDASAAKPSVPERNSPPCWRTSGDVPTGRRFRIPFATTNYG